MAVSGEPRLGGATIGGEMKQLGILACAVEHAHRTDGTTNFKALVTEKVW
jgi:hypothetical protein